jgi:hypothetical protein
MCDDCMSHLSEVLCEVKALRGEISELLHGPETSRQDSNGDTVWLAGTGWLR